MENNKLNKTNCVAELMKNNYSFIVQLAKEHHMFFAFCYFSHMFPLYLGKLQMDLFQEESTLPPRHMMYPSFPDSYCEMILMYTNILWRIFGVSQYTNCVIVCGTREKAKDVFNVFKNELLNNKSLQDFKHGVTKNSISGWSIIIPNYTARITITIYPTDPNRIKHKQRLPDMIIGVDLDSRYIPEGVLATWMKQVFYDPDRMYEQTIVLGTITKKENIFESVRQMPIESLFILPLPLFDNNKECFWKEKYSNEEITELLKDYDNPAWQLKYLCHTKKTIAIWQKWLNEDGSFDFEGYWKTDPKNGDGDNNFLSEMILYKNTRHHGAWLYRHIPNRDYYGIGEAFTFVIRDPNTPKGESKYFPWANIELPYDD